MFFGKETDKIMAGWLNNVSLSFDLDGTLIDTAPDLVRVLNLVIATDGLAPVKLEEARQLIGYGSMALIKKAYTLAGAKVEESKANQLRDLFLDLYAKDLSQLSHPYPGVREVLADLKRSGAKLSVCTNKPGYLARPLLEELDLTKFFARIVGSDDTSACKPAARHIYDAIGHRGESPSVMIGDAGPDVYAAKAAKIPVVLMSYGYSPVSIHSFGADAVLRSFRELPSALKLILQT